MGNNDVVAFNLLLFPSPYESLGNINVINVDGINSFVYVNTVQASQVVGIVQAVNQLCRVSL